MESTNEITSISSVQKSLREPYKNSSLVVKRIDDISSCNLFKFLL